MPQRLTCRRCGEYHGTTVVAITYVPAGRSGYLKRPNQSQRFQLSPQSKDPNWVVGSQSRSSGAFPLSSSRSTRMPLRTSVTFTYMISYRMDAGQTGGGGAIEESSVPLHDGRLVRGHPKNTQATENRALQPARNMIGAPNRSPPVGY